MGTKKWVLSKTIGAGILAAVGTLAAYFTGKIDLAIMLPALITSMCAIFLRSGFGVIKPSYQSKTIITAVAGLIGTVVAILTGEISTVSALPAIISAFTAIFLRQGVGSTIVK